jgi:hypothetical protein
MTVLVDTDTPAQYELVTNELQWETIDLLLRLKTQESQALGY